MSAESLQSGDTPLLRNPFALDPAVVAQLEADRVLAAVSSATYARYLLEQASFEDPLSSAIQAFKARLAQNKE